MHRHLPLEERLYPAFRTRRQRVQQCLLSAEPGLSVRRVQPVVLSCFREPAALNPAQMMSSVPAGCSSSETGAGTLTGGHAEQRVVEHGLKFSTSSGQQEPSAFVRKRLSQQAVNIFHLSQHREVLLPFRTKGEE